MPQPIVLCGEIIVGLSEQNSAHLSLRRRRSRLASASLMSAAVGLRAGARLHRANFNVSLGFLLRDVNVFPECQLETKLSDGGDGLFHSSSCLLKKQIQFVYRSNLRANEDAEVSLVNESRSILSDRTF